MLSSISRLQFHIYGVEVLDLWLVACNKINIYIVTPASVALRIYKFIPAGGFVHAESIGGLRRHPRPGEENIAVAHAEKLIIYTIT